LLYSFKAATSGLAQSLPFADFGSFDFSPETLFASFPTRRRHLFHCTHLVSNRFFRRCFLFVQIAKPTHLHAQIFSSILFIIVDFFVHFRFVSLNIFVAVFLIRFQLLACPLFADYKLPEEVRGARNTIAANLLQFVSPNHFVSFRKQTLTRSNYRQSLMTASQMYHLFCASFNAEKRIKLNLSSNSVHFLLAVSLTL
jgi:hypothetical protein